MRMSLSEKTENCAEFVAFTVFRIDSSRTIPDCCDRHSTINQSKSTSNTKQTNEPRAREPVAFSVSKRSSTLTHNRLTVDTKQRMKDGHTNAITVKCLSPELNVRYLQLFEFNKTKRIFIFFLVRAACRFCVLRALLNGRLMIASRHTVLLNACHGGIIVIAIEQVPIVHFVRGERVWVCACVRVLLALVGSGSWYEFQENKFR